MEIPVDKRKIFKREIEQLINREGIDNMFNIPDRVLAEYLVRCLENIPVTPTQPKWEIREMPGVDGFVAVDRRTFAALDTQFYRMNFVETHADNDSVDGFLNALSAEE